MEWGLRRASGWLAGFWPSGCHCIWAAGVPQALSSGGLSDAARLAPRCVAKRRRFAPAALYKPFGEEAAGARTLPQFQALQEGSRETASLRELGLSDTEIRLWTNRAAAEKVGGQGGGALTLPVGGGGGTAGAGGA